MLYVRYVGGADYDKVLKDYWSHEHAKMVEVCQECGGPTVQLAAAIMGAIHRMLRVPSWPSVYIVGGLAGGAASFNTPLAGVAFAIEELAAAYEDTGPGRSVDTVVVSIGIVSDHIYFGAKQHTLGFQRTLIATVLGCIAGGA